MLGTCAVGGIWILARQLFDPTTALFSAAIAAIHPEAIAPSVFVLSEAPFCPLIVAQLVCWTAAWQSRAGWITWLWAGLGGLIAGAATLMRPSWLLFTPFALVVALVLSPQRRRHLIVGGVMLLGLAVAMSPWWIRNFQVTGHFVPTTLQVGASLYDGWNPTATGGSEMEFVAEFTREQQRYDTQQQATHDKKPSGSLEERLDRRLRDAAVEWARQHPARVLQLAGIKFLRLWNVWPNDRDLGGGWMRLIIAGCYLPLLVGAVWGAFRSIRRGWPYVLCILPAAYFTLLHMVFVSSIRYRQPALLPLMVLAAAAWMSRRAESTDVIGKPA